MASELTMPALSPTMEKATLAKWLVREGDMVKPGDLIAEIETDKATMELEAEEEGRVSELVVAAGSEDVPVGAVIARLGDVAKSHASANASPPVAQAVAAPDLSAAPNLSAAPSISATPAPLAPTSEGVNATPLARRIAAAKGLSLSDINGSGPHGRIVKADLGLPAPEIPSMEPVLPAMRSDAPPAGVPVESVRLSAMRRTIARRLTEAKQTVPHFYLTAHCQLDALLKLRAELNATLADKGVKVSVNDMLIKAMALALVAVPDANVQFGGLELHRFRRVDISMAVAVDGGLVTPVIKDAGALSLSAIARQSKELAAKAREGRLMPEEYQGGTASISNLGMYGIDEMVPVINPPQALILGTAAGIERPWKVDGEIALATIMAATASFDHRAIDGATAAQFMAVFREAIETPLSILA